MKKFNAKYRQSARKLAFSRWTGVEKILKLLSRAEHSDNVEPVVTGFYATDLLVTAKSL
jgi:hypothetical protein